jgi:GT2 family glycosyltransferase
MMDLSVVVVSYNTRELLARCLRSIAETVRGLSVEVIVVDNASTDDSAMMVAREFPDARLLVNRANRGFAQANNVGIAQCSGRYVLLLNSDAILHAGAAQAMTALLDAHPEAGAVGGMLLNPDGSFQGSHADFPRLTDELLLLVGAPRWLRPKTYPSRGEADSQVRCRTGWVSGALLLLRREALAGVGLLDERFFMYAEEMDLCYRLRRMGWDVYYEPAARATHWGGASSDTVPQRKRAQLYYSKWLFFRKHRSRLVAATYGTLVWAATALKLAVWLPNAASANAQRRERARQQIASYRLLLANFLQRGIAATGR